VIQSFSNLGRSTQNLGLKLLIRVSHSPIYILGEFRSLSRSPSSKAELSRVLGIQEGATSFEDSVFEGVFLSLSA
jgi:hypothetical protein